MAFKSALLVAPKGKQKKRTAPEHLYNLQLFPSHTPYMGFFIHARGRCAAIEMGDALRSPITAFRWLASSTDDAMGHPFRGTEN